MVETLYQLAIESKNDQDALNQILKAFNPKIKKSLQQTNFQNREDLEQELQLKLVNLIKMCELDDLDGFWEFYNKVNNSKKGCK